MPSILVTGANGFVGRELCRCLALQGHNIIRCVRQSYDQNEIAVGTIDASTEWMHLLNNVDIVIHLAARVHLMQDHARDPLSEYRSTNTHATLNLAKQAAKAGVKRLIYLSSIKVNGESTPVGKPFTNLDIPQPQDPYGISKKEAEDGLRIIAADMGMEVVIIRPPLIYGRGVKANFLKMMKWVNHQIPLPLGAIKFNRRSLVALGNLIDLISVCVSHPAAANQTLLVSDDEDLSTTELLNRIGSLLGKPTRLISIYPALIQLMATIFCRPDIAERLLGSLQVDIEHTCKLLDWKPPLSVNEGLSQVLDGVSL